MKLKLILAGILVSAATSVSAATATFDIVIERGTGPGEGQDATGETFSGSLSYVDGIEAPVIGGGFTIDEVTSFSLNFLDRVIDDIDSFDEATFDATGALIALQYFYDVGTFLLDFELGDETFSYSYSRFDPVFNGETQEEEQVQIFFAGGNGRLVLGSGEPPEPPSEVPLPASGFLLLAGLSGLVVAKRKRT